jgi:hypothetical protein
MRREQRGPVGRGEELEQLPVDLVHPLFGSLLHRLHRVHRLVRLVDRVLPFYRVRQLDRVRHLDRVRQLDLEGEL